MQGRRPKSDIKRDELNDVKQGAQKPTTRPAPSMEKGNQKKQNNMKHHENKQIQLRGILGHPDNGLGPENTNPNRTWDYEQPTDDIQPMGSLSYGSIQTDNGLTQLEADSNQHSPQEVQKSKKSRPRNQSNSTRAKSKVKKYIVEIYSRNPGNGTQTTLF